MKIEDRGSKTEGRRLRAIRDPRSAILGSSALVVVSATTLTVAAALGLARFGYALLIPDMRAALGAGYTDMGALATANFCGYLVAAGLAGPFARRLGPRRATLIALTLTGLATGLTGLVPSVLVAAGLQLVVGLGSAASVIPAYAIAAIVTTPQRRGLSVGFTAGGAGIGLAASGLLLPGVLGLGADGWRWGWALLGVLIALVAVYVAYAVPPAAGHGSATAPAQPGGYARLFRNRGVWWLAGVYLLWGFAYVVFATFFASAAISEGGWDAVTAGRLWALTGVVAIGSCPLWGWLSDRWGRPLMLGAVLALQGSACAIVALEPASAGYVVAAVLFAIGGFGVPTLVNASAADVVGAALATTAIGVLTMFFGLGQALGPLVAGALRDATHTFAASFTVAAIALGVGAVAAAAGQRRQPQRAPARDRRRRREGS